MTGFQLEIGSRNLRKEYFVAIILLLLLVSSIAYYFSRPGTIQKSQYTTEYFTGSKESTPNSIAVDSRGNVWFALQNKSAIAELNPSTGSIKQFHLPIGNKSITTWGMVIDNQRKLVWFTEQVTNSIWSFNMTDHKFTAYHLKTTGALPFGIALDPQGNVWFTEFFGDKIGEITTSGVLSEIQIPASGYLEASAVFAAPSGKIWFTLPGINSTASYFKGSFTIQNLTSLVNIPVGIAIDSSGNLWLTQHGPSFISEFNPTTHYFKTISTSIPPLGTSLPYFSYVNSNGDVWFNEHYGNAMAEFIPSSNTLIEYFIPTRVGYAGNISGMLTSTLSSSGQPWYTEFFAGKVGTVNVSKPLDLGLSLSNYSNTVTIHNGDQVSLSLSLSGTAAQSASLRGSVGNFTGNFVFDFSHLSRNNTSLLTIHNDGSKPGIYFVTITALTTPLAISKIIEIVVP